MTAFIHNRHSLIDSRWNMPQKYLFITSENLLFGEINNFSNLAKIAFIYQTVWCKGTKRRCHCITHSSFGDWVPISWWVPCCAKSPVTICLWALNQWQQKLKAFPHSWLDFLHVCCRLKYKLFQPIINSFISLNWVVVPFNPLLIELLCSRRELCLAEGVWWKASSDSHLFLDSSSDVLNVWSLITPH